MMGFNRMFVMQKLALKAIFKFYAIFMLCFIGESKIRELL